MHDTPSQAHTSNGQRANLTEQMPLKLLELKTHTRARCAETPCKKCGINVWLSVCESVCARSELQGITFPVQWWESRLLYVVRHYVCRRNGLPYVRGAKLLSSPVQKCSRSLSVYVCLGEERSGEDTREERDDGEADGGRAVALGGAGGLGAGGAALGGGGRARGVAALVDGRVGRAGGGGARAGDDAGVRDGVGVERGRGHLDTVARRGRRGHVGHRGDRARRLGGLGVRLGRAGGVGVDTGDDHVVGVADLEVARGRAGTERVLGWAVVRETDTVESVLAVTRVVVTLRVANLDAELAVTNEPIVCD